MNYKILIKLGIPKPLNRNSRFSISNILKTFDHYSKVLTITILSLITWPADELWPWCYQLKMLWRS